MAFLHRSALRRSGERHLSLCDNRNTNTSCSPPDSSSSRSASPNLTPRLGTGGVRGQTPARDYVTDPWLIRRLRRGPPYVPLHVNILARLGVAIVIGAGGVYFQYGRLYSQIKGPPT